MAALQKYWREAATLIVVARTNFPGVHATATTTTPSKSFNRLKTDFDYHILMLKRSSKSKFMPSAYVFPGGVASDADFSPEWGKIFAKAGVDLSNWGQWRSSNKDVSPMLTRQRAPEHSAIPADVAFRICAIRETFEESGVLIVRNASSSKLNEAVNLFSARRPVTSSLCHRLDKEKLGEWRKCVDKDAGDFLQLCQEMDFLPDVWSLYDWCNWLTPTSDLPVSNAETGMILRRFDTAFYLCVLDEVPAFVEHDSQETVHTQWCTPLEVLTHFREESLWIAPPQIYELSRLIQFSTADQINQFVNERAPYQMERWLPIRVGCADGALSVFPGDCLYPENPDHLKTGEPIVREITLCEGRKDSKQNRMEVVSRFGMTVQCTIDQSPNHISPVSGEDLALLHPVPTANL